MGEARRKKKPLEQTAKPGNGQYRSTVDLHTLPPVEAINGARIRELTGDGAIPAAARIILQAFRAKVGKRAFHVGFCLGNGTGFSAIGIAVIDRLMREAPGETAPCRSRCPSGHCLGHCAAPSAQLYRAGTTLCLP